MEKYFNFNNEEYILTINVENDGRVTFATPGQTMQFDSVLELAHNYAMARNVSAENLKNWVLVEDGDYYSFVLRAATAGADFFAEDSETEDEDYYDDEDYDESDDVITLDTLTSEEYEVLKFMHDGEDIASLIYDNEELYDELQAKVIYFTERTHGNFKLGLGIEKMTESLEYGEVPEPDNDAANKQLAMANIARRNTIQVPVVNLTSNELCFVQRSTLEPFRPTELVVKIAGVFVVFER